MRLPALPLMRAPLRVPAPTLGPGPLKYRQFHCWSPIGGARKAVMDSADSSPPQIVLTLARVRLFTASNVCVCGGGGGAIRPPLSRSAPDGLRASRTKNECVALNERKPMVPNFKVSGQPMTSEVRSNTRSGPSDTTIFGMLQSRLEWENLFQIGFKHFKTPGN